jgi:hypothetical protein
VAIDVRMLPEIVEYLLVGGEPAFVVLRYDQFVWLAATMADAPDVMSVLDSGNERHHRRRALPAPAPGCPSRY